MAILAQGIGTVNFEVYLSGTSRLLGMANVELVTVEKETVDMKGSGIAGTRSMPIRANVGSMELKLTWRVTEPDAFKIFTHRAINLSMYSDQEHYDDGRGTFSDPQHRLEVRGIPKTFNLGKWEPSTTSDAETTLEVVTLYYYIDGVEKIGFEPFNYILRIDGVDEGEPTRRALGWF